MSGSTRLARSTVQAAPTGPQRRGPVLAPSRLDPFVAGVSGLIGGPVGSRALLGERRFWTPLRWLVLLTLITSALGLWQKAPCRVHPWTHHYQYTRGCYSDVFALWNSEGLDRGATPYLGHPVEYPVVIGAAMALTAGVTGPVARLRPDPTADRARRALAQAEAAGPAGSGTGPTGRPGDRQSRINAARYALDAATAATKGRTFYDLSWILLTACALVVTITTARLAGRRRMWDAAMFAAGPVLLLHATTNWDLIAVALTGLGLLAWARRQPVLAGVLLGLGTATKLYPVLFVVPLLALCWRADRLRVGLRTTLALLLTAAAVTVPVYLASPSYADLGGTQVRLTASAWDRLGSEGLAALSPHATVAAPQGPGTVTAVNAVYRFVELNRQRPADWDSLAFVLQNLRDDQRLRWHGIHWSAPFAAVAGLVLDRSVPPGGAPQQLNRAVAVGVLLGLALVVLLALRAPRRPRLPQLLFLTLAGFLLANKVFSPQYSLWLLPLAVLARPAWRPFLAWQAAEVFLLFTRFYYFVSLPGTSEGIDVWWFLSAVLIRDAVLVGLMAAVVRDVLRPDRDVVREDGRPATHPADAASAAELDDPVGGVLAGAPDRSDSRSAGRESFAGAG